LFSLRTAEVLCLISVINMAAHRENDSAQRVISRPNPFSSYGETKGEGGAIGEKVVQTDGHVCALVGPRVSKRLERAIFGEVVSMPTALL
jgi:hypothetical protein